MHKFIPFILFVLPFIDQALLLSFDVVSLKLVFIVIVVIFVDCWCLKWCCCCIANQIIPLFIIINHGWQVTSLCRHTTKNPIVSIKLQSRVNRYILNLAWCICWLLRLLRSEAVLGLAKEILGRHCSLNAYLFILARELIFGLFQVNLLLLPPILFAVELMLTFLF